MKTFYTLTPEAFTACVKLEQALDLISDVNYSFEIDPTEIEDQASKNPVYYLFKQFHDGEFCDHDNLSMDIPWTRLENEGLIKETFVKDPTQI